jgi:hypothetical protein
VQEDVWPIAPRRYRLAPTGRDGYRGVLCAGEQGRSPGSSWLLGPGQWALSETTSWTYGSITCHTCHSCHRAGVLGGDR